MKILKKLVVTLAVLINLSEAKADENLRCLKSSDSEALCAQTTDSQIDLRSIAFQYDINTDFAEIVDPSLLPATGVQGLELGKVNNGQVSPIDKVDKDSGNADLILKDILNNPSKFIKEGELLLVSYTETDGTEPK